MDVELFLEIQNKWAEDSPHRLVILYEMFWHAAIKGQKEVEMNHLPRPPAEYASAEPRGGHTCRSAGGARNNQGGTTWDIFRSIQIT